jgi:carbon storage regulator
MLVLSRKVGERIAVRGNILVSAAPACGRQAARRGPAGVSVERREDRDSRSGETVIIDGQVAVKVVKIVGDQVKVGVEAPRDVPILREELLASDATAAD